MATPLPLPFEDDEDTRVLRVKALEALKTVCSTEAAHEKSSTEAIKKLDEMERTRGDSKAFQIAKKQAV